MPKILLVDDDPQSLESTRKILEAAGHEVTCARDGSEGLELARVPVDGAESPFDLIVTDVRMPKMDGMEFLKTLSYCGGGVPVVLMTAFGRVDEAVWAMKMGAVDFLSKPFKRQALMSSVESAMKRARVRRKAQAPSAESGSIIGSSQATTELRKLIERVAPTETTVLITGESGTGKELVAHAIHQLSGRARKPFVALNCAAIPENLIESELFGHEKGAFSGATTSKVGLFEAADGGTLFLDEMGDMPLPLQAKLLRTLQESEVRRVGSTQSKKIDVRVVSATHRDLKQRVREGLFREDLLFRLDVVGIPLSALRERPEDISTLAYHFLQQAVARHGKMVASISPEAMQILQGHAWPGNARELSNVIERAVVFAASDELASADLPPHLLDLSSAPAQSTISVPLGTSLKDVEDLLIRKTLEATSGDKNRAAKILGVNSRTIYRKLEKPSAS